MLIKGRNFCQRNIMIIQEVLSISHNWTNHLQLSIAMWQSPHGQTQKSFKFVCLKTERLNYSGEADNLDCTCPAWDVPQSMKRIQSWERKIFE